MQPGSASEPDTAARGAVNGWRDPQRREAARDAITAARNRLRVTITRHRFDHTATCVRCKAKHTTTFPEEAVQWAEQHQC